MPAAAPAEPPPQQMMARQPLAPRPTDGAVHAQLRAQSSGVVLDKKLPVKRPYAPERKLVRWIFLVLFLLVAGGGVAAYFYYPPVRAWWLENWPF